MAKYTGTVDTASSRGVSVTAGSGTKGSYVQVFSSTPAAAKCLWLVAEPASVAPYRVDIGVGAAGSETVLVPDILIDGSVSGNLCIPLPIAVAAGSRLAVRAQSSAANVIYIALTIDTNGFTNGTELTSAVALGVSGNGGTVIDPGATASTKGAWTEITASSPQALKALVICTGNNANSANQLARFYVDVGTGASGSESVVIPDIFFNHNDNEAPANMASGPYLVDIASGTRIAVRAQCHITDATDRLFSCVILGFYGEPSVTVNGAATLSAQASVSATAALLAAPTGALNAQGGMTAGAALLAAPTVSLAGTGSISATGALNAAGTAQLSGLGNISPTGAIVASGASQLSASGTVSATGALTVSATVQLAGTGSISASSSLIVAGASQLNAIGSLSAIGEVAQANVITGTANLTGVGSLSVSADVAYSAASTLSAAGLISATPALLASAATLLASQGSISASGTVTYAGAAHLAAAATLAAIGSNNYSAVVTLAGAASISASANLTNIGAAHLTASSDLLATSAVLSEAASALAAQASLTAQAFIIAVGNAALFGSAQLDAQGTVTPFATPFEHLNLAARSSALQYQNNNEPLDVIRQ